MEDIENVKTSICGDTDIMSTKKVGKTIQMARELAGMTQEQLCEGICEPVSLSRIENDKAGVSPETFQALMQRTGVNCQVIPEFENKTSFQAYLKLEEAAFLIRMGKIQPAWENLVQIAEMMEGSRNPFFYQKFAYLQILAMQKCEKCDYADLHEHLASLIRLTIPSFTGNEFPKQALTILEIQMLLSYSDILLHLGKIELCREYCKKLTNYLKKDGISLDEKNYFLTGAAIIECKAAICDNNGIKGCYDYLQKMYTICVECDIADMWIPVYFQLAVCHYELGERERVVQEFKIAYYAAKATENCLAYNIKKQIQNLFGISIMDTLENGENENSIPEFVPIALKFNPIDVQQIADLTHPYQLGNIIHDIRIEQKVTMEELCRGLCAKSTLSKIEAGTIMPGRYVGYALLQRLGLNGDMFYFFSSKKEFANYELQRACVNCFNMETGDEKSKTKELLEKLEQSCVQKDILTRQFCTVMKARLLVDWRNHLDEYHGLLERGLACTIPDFEEMKIDYYHMSYSELSIINQIVLGYVLGGQRNRGIRVLYRLMDYYGNNFYTVQEKVRTFPIALQLLCHYLYLENRFTEILELGPLIKDNCLGKKLGILKKIYLYYAQALSEQGEKARALKYARYTYVLDIIQNDLEGAGKVKTDLLKEYQMKISL